MGDSMYVLWFEGIAPERLQELPAAPAIATQGVDVRLVPLPLVEAANCYYQALTGIGSGKSGRFDAVHPIAYKAQTDAATPEGAWQRLLPDLVRAGQRSATLLETDAEHAAYALENATEECVLLRLRDAGRASVDALDAIVRQGVDRAGDAGHIIVLTDVWTPPPRRLVNVNTFLKDAGVLETGPGASPGRRIVWSETLAYGLGTGQVWLNMHGREPEGVVEPGREYDEVRAALMDALRNDWRDPETDEPVIAQVLAKEEAYTGEHVFKAPDLVLVYCAGYAPSPRAFVLDLDNTSVLPHDESGDQNTDASTASTASTASMGGPYARLIGRGPALMPGAEATGELIDLVPSLLYLLGLPILQHLDGQVMTAMFTPAYRARMPILQAGKGATSLSGEEEDVIMGRLQALGYLG
jgi:hypothetical protein